MACSETSPSPKIFTPQIRSIQRNEMIECMTKHCGVLPIWQSVPTQRQTQIVESIERGCHNEAIQYAASIGVLPSFDCAKYVNRYSEICYKVLENLNAIIDKVIDNKIRGSQLAAMSSEMLNPDASAELRRIIKIRQQQVSIQKTSALYICPKCKHNKTIPIEYQSTSSDEAPTLSLQCVNCHFVWRQH
jgi:DNA-directed RNA polymerase subunit M/transcription elongation factor TFIIS